MAKQLVGQAKFQVPGGQAELLRVPHADYGPIVVPEGPPDDRFLFLTKSGSIRLPNIFMPPLMSNHGNYIGSLGNLCKWLGEQAAELALRVAEQREWGETTRLVEGCLAGLTPRYRTALILKDLHGLSTAEIAQAAGLETDTALREKVERLIELDYVRAGRNLGAKPRERFRYRVADPAFRFFYDFVAPLESVLATQDPAVVWERHIAPSLDAYTGLVFEGMVEEAYYRLQPRLDLPLVREWGRWEDVDRGRQPLEIDIATILMDQRVLTGAIKWWRGPVDVDVHTRHLEMLDRLSQAGVAWAHEAKKGSAPLLYVSASGFTDRFIQAARATRDEVYLWTLDDLF